MHIPDDEFRELCERLGWSVPRGTWPPRYRWTLQDDVAFDRAYHAWLILEGLA